MRPESRISAWTDRLEGVLDFVLPPEREAPERLHAAMRYAALGAGKRVRPLLVYAAGTAVGASERLLDLPAAAVELVHAYSLVHDDLPAMDDDNLRRGRPTVHIAFDHATAILAGDALQTLAFDVIANTSLPALLRIEVVRSLAQASGSRGMCGGQSLDLAATGASIELDALDRMHALKTGALIRSAVRIGAIVAGADEDAMERLDRYATALGLAFQIRDDILDVEGASEVTGKTRGKDARQGKSTYATLLGLEASRQRLRELADAMHAALDGWDADCEPLACLARLTVERAR